MTKPIVDIRSIAVFLDVDGTLIDIALTPDRVVIPDGLVDLVRELTRHAGGALAIVTGRPIAEVDRFLAPLAPVAAGVHGAQLRRQPDGAVELRAKPIDADLVAAVQREIGSRPNIMVEAKPTSIAIHYRQAPNLAAELEAVLERILKRSADHLVLAHGRKVMEIVPRDVSKGDALKLLMELPDFRGRKPVMIGDDVSDQSAFEAATNLGGFGLKVAGERFSVADADFANPTEVRAWLATLVGSDGT